ncbi:homospermidine synthase [Sorangium cellulosum]|uniref:Homospermidine synthase n=1 Tax=Sorangium cellulosum TaxID=56 RepID=A0A4P2Q5F3_SORCE|nr:saccharopine dehydrogenase C-terminal domain-containing protein [Sorangium cellulosum]AUX24635.1 homospermidine synthase [Sorangium cellulosum]
MTKNASSERKQAASSIDFGGRIVIVGCGSIGQTVLPLLHRHVPHTGDGLVVLSADEQGRKVAENCGASFAHTHLTPSNLRAILTRYVRSGDLLLNLSVDVGSMDLIRFCASQGALYVDSSIEPWPGVFDNAMLDMVERTNFVARERVRDLAVELGPDAPTAVVAHGANPGLVSHFVKRALLDLDRELRDGSARPTKPEEWAQLACDLGVTCIQISERDTQVSSRPKRHGEFINTWSIDGFVDELMQPSELSFGTAERHTPKHAREHRAGSGTLYLERPGGATFARSWVPSLGGFQGMLVTHDEVFSIADYLSLRDGDRFVYRPSVMFVYHPCDDAMLSALELEGRGWKMQPTRRRLGPDIVSGMDELGVLLAGHSRNAYWYGSQLSIEDARRCVSLGNATSLQVAAGVIAGMIWAIRHPRRGVVEPDELDFEECLEIASPYLGRMTSEFSDWTPLEGRGELFPEELDVERPWQLQNIRSRQWPG